MAERSRHVVLVLPPAIERVGPVWDLPGLAPGVSQTAPSVVVVCADHDQAAAWAAAAPADYRAHAVTSLNRSAALMKEGRTGLVAGAAADLSALVARSALKLASVDTIVIAWPETFSDTLDPLLAEAPEAQRVVLSWNPPALGDFLERHARRAEFRGSLALGAVCTAWYAVVSAGRRDAAAREVRSHAPDVPLCTTLPTPDELADLAKAGRGQPVVLVTATQIPYLRAIATLAPLALSGAADRAQDRNAALRGRIAERLGRRDLDAELALLQPLFEDWDPAEVAAALLAMSRQPSAVIAEDVVAAPADQWAKVFINVGKKDRAGPKDLVGALIKEVGLEKAQIGRIDMRDSFALVEVSPAVAEAVVRRTTGLTIKGKRVSAKMDQGG